MRANARSAPRASEPGGAHGKGGKGDGPHSWGKDEGGDPTAGAAEREQLAAALDRLGNVQRLLANSQATLIQDQQRLAQLVMQLNEGGGAGGEGGSGAGQSPRREE